MSHTKKCARAAEIVHEHGSIDLIDLPALQGGDVGIYGPELADGLAAAAGRVGPLAEAVRKLAEVILFSANEGK